MVGKIDMVDKIDMANPPKQQTRGALWVVPVLVAGFVAVAFGAFWISFLPGRLADKIIADVARKTGLTLVVKGGSNLSFGDGAGVRLNDVELAHEGKDEKPVAVAKSLFVKVDALRLLGAAAEADDVTLVEPVFTLALAGAAAGAAAGAGAAGAEAGDGKTPLPDKRHKPGSLTIVDGTMKLTDDAHAFGLAVTDIRGRFTRDEQARLEGDLKALLNGRLTHVQLGIDDTRRLSEDGSPSDISLTSDAGALSFSGRFRTAGAVELDGQARGTAPLLGPFLNWLGLPVSGFAAAKQFNLESAVSVTGAKVALKGLKLGVDGTRVLGTAAFDLEGQRPFIEADLAFDVLDTGTYRRTELGTTGAGATGAEAKAPSLADPWREVPIAFRDLSTIDGRFAITTDTLLLGGLTSGAARIDANMKNGIMSATLASDSVAGGKVRLATTIAQRVENDAAIGFELATEQVDAQGFLGPLLGFHALSGPLDITARLKADGSSEAALVSSLAGEVTIDLKDGSLDGIDLGSTLGGSTGWVQAAGKATRANLHAVARVQEGVAVVSEARMTAGGVALEATGEIDILRQALDLQAKPRIESGGESVKLPVALQLRGPWTAPSISASSPVIDAVKKGAADIDADAVEALARKAGKKAKKVLKGLLGD